MPHRQFSTKSLLVSLKLFIEHRFDLREGKADNQQITDEIRQNVVFKGANLWILMFAIMVASVGLDVNSTAVVIGAMLISPFDGPHHGHWAGSGYQ